MTKKLLLLPSVLLGAMLIAAPAMTQDFTINAGDVNGVGSANVAVPGTFSEDPPPGGSPSPKDLFSGILFGTGGVWYWNSSWQENTDETPGSGLEYLVDGDLVLVGFGPATGNQGVAAIATDDSAGTFTFGNIQINGTANASDELAGFVFRNDGNFSGNVTGTGTIRVEATGTDAFGIYFRDTTKYNTDATTDVGFWANVTGNIGIETISASSTTHDAYGLVAGAVSGGTIAVEDVTAHGLGGNATGIQIFSGSASTGTVVIGKADVRAMDVARVLLVGGEDADEEMQLHSIGTVGVGFEGIQAHSTGSIGGDAFGIHAGGIDRLVLLGDIEATSASGAARGIVTTGNTNIIVGFMDEDEEFGDDPEAVFTGLVNITAADGAISTTGDLNILVEYGSSFTTANDIIAGGDVDIFANGDEDNPEYASYVSLGHVESTSGAVDVKAEWGSEAVIGSILAQDSVNVTAYDAAFDAAGDQVATITIGSIVATTGDVSVDVAYDGALAVGSIVATTGDVLIQIGGDDGTGIALIGGIDSVDLSVTNTSEDEIAGWGSDDPNYDKAKPSLVLGTINITGTANFYAGDGITAFDFVQSTFANDGSVEDGAFLGFYTTADEAVARAFDFDAKYGDWDFDGVTDLTEVIFDVDEMYNWDITATNVAFGGVRARANMSDGFVAALSMRNTYTAWNAVRNHMISGSGSSARGYRGQSPCCEVAPCDPCGGGVFSGSANRSAWVNYNGRSVALASEFHDEWKLSAEGVQAGVDLFKTRKEQFGVLFGYEGAKMRAGVADRIKSDDTYAGIYGARVLRNGADVRGVFAYGWQDYDMSRLSAADGTLYTSSFKGYTTETNLELGKRLGAGSGWSLRPVIGLDILTNNLKSAQEVGGAGAVRYGKTSLTQAFFRFGSDVRYQMSGFTLNSGLYYAYDMNGADVNTRILRGTTESLLVGSKPGRELVTFNVGGDYRLSRNFSVFGAYEGQAVVDRSGGFQHLGYIGGAVKW